jgi:hypothetical protein
MAMGIPCSGGRGSIEIAGKSYNPKMLSFHLATSCNMFPATAEDLRLQVGKQLGLGTHNPLLAYNPLAVQYWQVIGGSDADASERIDIRGNDENLRMLWNDFREGKRKIPVAIYGRENAWVNDDQLFKVTGELSFQAPMHFVFQVSAVSVMSRDELKTLNDSCQSARVRKNCSDLF